MRARVGCVDGGSTPMIGGLVSRTPAFAALVAIGASVTPARAVDGTWTGATTNEWTTGTNWTSTPIVPNNTATFTNNGAPTSVTISNSTSINTIQFDAAVPAYSFTNSAFSFDILGTGIVNNSANAPIFINNGALNFFSSSTAGTAVIT